MVTFGLPDLLLVFFQGLCQLHQASLLQQEVECLQLEAEFLETKGLQQVEFSVARSKAEGLYDILSGAMTQSELSKSVGLPLPYRCRQASAATVSCLTAQETKAAAFDPSVQKLDGGASEQWSPPLPVPQSQGMTYPLR